jgi:hypothetical protein
MQPPTHLVPPCKLISYSPPAGATRWCECIGCGLNRIELHFNLEPCSDWHRLNNHLRLRTGANWSVLERTGLTLYNINSTRVSGHDKLSWFDLILERVQAAAAENRLHGNIDCTFECVTQGLVNLALASSLWLPCRQWVTSVFFAFIAKVRC